MSDLDPFFFYNSDLGPHFYERLYPESGYKMQIRDTVSRAALWRVQLRGGQAVPQANLPRHDHLQHLRHAVPAKIKVTVYFSKRSSF